HRALVQPRLVVRPPPRASLTECLERDIPPRRLAALLAGSNAWVEELPPCLAGGRPLRQDPPQLSGELGDALDAEALAALVARFAAWGYRARSRRCASCRCSTRRSATPCSTCRRRRC
ncbi:MAG: hypothetical protein ACOCXZ_00495, partial [Chloroflexota bacterium]